MIGETYFQTRAQLGTTLFSLRTLASDCHAPASTLITLQQLQDGLREPFCFVAVGGAKSGKSSLFNALFGREVNRGDEGGSGYPIRVLKYADEEREEAVDERILECFRSANILRDFSLVEVTIGDGMAAVQALFETQFVPRADLIFFVFSALDPWAENTWQSLARLDRETMKRAVIIVQQSDLRTASEVEIIVQQVEQSLEERLGQNRPVFGVSAERAFEARSKHREVDDPGFRRLEALIDDTVTANPNRCERLADVSQTAQALLRELGSDCSISLARSARDGRSAEQLTSALQVRHEESLRQIAGVLWTLTQAGEATQRQADNELAGVLNLARLASLLFCRRPSWAGTFQRGVEQQLQEATARLIESSVRRLSAELRADGQRLQAGLEKHFDADLRSALNLPDIQTSGAILTKELRRIVEPALPSSENEPWLGCTLASVGAWLWLPVTTVLAIVGFAVYVTLENSAIKELAIAAAATAGIALLVTALAIQNRVQLGFRRHMAEPRELSINRIEDHLRQVLDDFYQRLDSVLQPLRDHCLVQRKANEAKLARVRQLGEIFTQVSEMLPLSPAAGSSPFIAETGKFSTDGPGAE